VITIPTPLVIQRTDEEIGGFEILQEMSQLDDLKWIGEVAERSLDRAKADGV